MKIHQNALMRNTSFIAAQNLKQISNNLIQANDNKYDSRTLKLSLFDRTKRIRPLIIDDANICIIGENPDYRRDLSHHIQTCYMVKRRLVKQIGLKKFSNLLVCERNDPNVIYIVEGSTKDLSHNVLAAILKQFTNIFIFQLEGLDLACSYSGETKSTPSCDEICAAIGGNQLLRKYLLSTLNEREFLAITSNEETTRALKKRKKIVYCSEGRSQDE